MGGRGVGGTGQDEDGGGALARTRRHCAKEDSGRRRQRPRPEGGEQQQVGADADGLRAGRPAAGEREREDRELGAERRPAAGERVDRDELCEDDGRVLQVDRGRREEVWEGAAGGGDGPGRRREEDAVGRQQPEGALGRRRRGLGAHSSPASAITSSCAKGHRGEGRDTHWRRCVRVRRRRAPLVLALLALGQQQVDKRRARRRLETRHGRLLVRRRRAPEGRHVRRQRVVGVCRLVHLGLGLRVGLDVERVVVVALLLLPAPSTDARKPSAEQRKDGQRAGDGTGTHADAKRQDVLDHAASHALARVAAEQAAEDPQEEARQAAPVERLERGRRRREAWVGEDFAREDCGGQG